ncbi:Response regulator receiver domain-containing protein [Desulforhopalus singaporensis]|uniref:Response regulator receiver domain-containing protein n=2 Tax=Desulforhopalus singaporensis TaxID=91360 RepID=A0A1H0J0G5_9BACT|nr:Response regulator receiver domain-containing protein [Desulforhopalus singaporensis]
MIAFLKAEGFRVLKALTGPEALESIEKGRPDLVLADLNMPEMNGMELLRTISERFVALPVIVVADTDSTGLALEALDAGAKGYLAKPIVDMGLLKHSVELVLSHTRLVSENQLYRKRFERLVEKRTADLWKKNIKLMKQLDEKRKKSAFGAASRCADDIENSVGVVADCLNILEQSYDAVARFMLRCSDMKQSEPEGGSTFEIFSEFRKLTEELCRKSDGQRVPDAFDKSRKSLLRISSMARSIK